LQRWRSKVEIIPIGVRDHAALVDPVRVAAIQAANGPGPLVFALGRMTYYKGFDVLIRAAASLPPQVRVVIGGDGEMLEPLRALVASSGLAGRLQLPGAIADEDVYNWFAACDVFCMPSTLRAEAYGVAMLEAMVMGKPVLAGNIEGSAVPWVNQHGVTGFNVPVGDAAALARSLHELLAQPDLRSRLGRAARQRYEQGLTGRLMTERTIALYRRLLGADATQQNRQGSSIS
jgi:rhamnosyl/mannosyltransferase